MTQIQANVAVRDTEIGGLISRGAPSVQSFAALASVIGGQFIKYLRNPPAQLDSLERFRQDGDSGQAIVMQCFGIPGHYQVTVKIGFTLDDDDWREDIAAIELKRAAARPRSLPESYSRARNGGRSPR